MSSPSLRAHLAANVNELKGGFFVGGIVGVLLLSRVREELASSPLSDQMQAVGLTWLLYASIGFVATAGLIAATGLWRRGPTLWPSWLWPPAASVAAALWIEVTISTHALRPVALLGLAALVAVAAFALVTALVQAVPALRQSSLQAFSTLAVLATLLVAMLFTRAAPHGAFWADGITLAPVLLLSTAHLAGTGGRGNKRRLSALILALPIVCGGLILWTIEGTWRMAPSGNTRTNVLLVTIDTLRADHLGAYGSRVVRTPNLDRLAAEGILFENVISPIPLTNPAHTTILTGLLPGKHGVTLNRPIKLGPEIRALPDLLQDRGHRTAAFVGSRVLDKRLSTIHERFQYYDDDLSPVPAVREPALRTGAVELIATELGKHTTRLEKRAESVVTSARRWLRRHRVAPFFLWVHLYDPHGGYEPPPPYDDMYVKRYKGELTGDWYELDQKRQELATQTPSELEFFKGRYAGEVSYTDLQVQRLLKTVDELGLRGRTLVVLTADHGESLTEHGYYFDHSVSLYDVSLRVPLILRFPDGRHAGTRVASTAGLADILPTVLGACGLEPPLALDGRSLLVELDGSAQAEPDRILVSAVYRGEIQGGKRLLALRSRHHKYIRTSAFWNDRLLLPPTEELYNLEDDPGETVNLAKEESQTLEMYRNIADDYWQRWINADARESQTIGEQEEQALRALGYLQ